jgi:hypothetical protein
MAPLLFPRRLLQLLRRRLSRCRRTSTVLALSIRSSLAISCDEYPADRSNNIRANCSSRPGLPLRPSGRPLNPARRRACFNWILSKIWRQSPAIPCRGTAATDAKYL